jgi:GNAT superfamily N-acetyltransferase
MMADIRRATPDDMDALVALAYAMQDESPRFRLYRFLPDRIRTTLTTLLDTRQGFVVVAEVEGVIVGGFAGMACPHFACDVLQAQDIALFVAPSHRGGTLAARLVRSFLEWSRSINAEPTIGINTGVTPERTAQLLAALGARQSGTNWTWGI